MTSYDQDRQFDPQLLHPYIYTVPRFMPGISNAQDYIQFYWPAAMNASDYDVVVETLVSRGGYYRKIGPLDSRLRLPGVQLPANGALLVLPRHTKSLPAFKAQLHRGSTYIIPSVTKNGVYEMEQHGSY